MSWSVFWPRSRWSASSWPHRGRWASRCGQGRRRWSGSLLSRPACTSRSLGHPGPVLGRAAHGGSCRRWRPAAAPGRSGRYGALSYCLPPGLFLKVAKGNKSGEDKRGPEKVASNQVISPITVGNKWRRTERFSGSYHLWWHGWQKGLPHCPGRHARDLGAEGISGGFYFSAGEGTFQSIGFYFHNTKSRRLLISDRLSERIALAENTQTWRYLFLREQHRSDYKE